MGFDPEKNEELNDMIRLVSHWEMNHEFDSHFPHLKDSFSGGLEEQELMLKSQTNSGSYLLLIPVSRVNPAELFLSSEPRF